MGLSRQQNWSRLPFHSPEDLPNPGIEPGSPALHADSLLAELQGKPHVTGGKDRFTEKQSRMEYLEKDLNE